MIATVDPLIPLLRGLNHSMRNPLGTLLSTSDMLLMGVCDELTPKQQRAVTRIQRNSSRMLRLLEDFTLFVRAQRRDLPVSAHTFELRACFEEILATLAPALDPHNITTALHIDADVPKTYVADVTHIKRIVLSLLWNAVAVTPDGGQIHVEVSWLDSRQVSVVVRDEGTGIAPEHTDSIWEPFWTGDVMPEHVQSSGYGMGLPLARAIADALNATLTLEHTSANGGVFRLCLPPL